jgi:putative transposase
VGEIPTVYSPIHCYTRGLAVSGSHSGLGKSTGRRLVDERADQCRTGVSGVAQRLLANAWDNAPMESFFKTLKVERIYQLRYETRDHARLDIVDWIEGYYNRKRIHSSIGYRTPVQAEETLMAA